MLLILYLGCHYDVTDLSFFFFQAEDGIRDLTVTGVQTCALPISATTPSAPSNLPPSGTESRCDPLQTSACFVRPIRLPAGSTSTFSPASRIQPEIGRASCRERV